MTPQNEPDAFSWLDPDQVVSKKYAHQPREFKLNRDVMRDGMAKLSGSLKLLGYDSLRPGQDKAVLMLLSQKDTYCVLPTGAGKSAIYIVPTLCMGWKTLVFSPLVSLMADQVGKLGQFRLAGASISSGNDRSENQLAIMQWEMGQIQFLLVAPERMDNQGFIDAMERCPPDLVVVDEAHCISQWGDSFRTSYLRIGDFIARTRPKVVLSLTATATKAVEDDIRSVLGIQQAARVIYYPKRTNLKHKTASFSDDHILMHLTRVPGSTIVYCATRKECERLCISLKGELDPLGSCLVYHGGMESSDRSNNQRRFMENEIRVMFATNAFGLGVDKPDIRGILHRHIPGSIEAIVQEQGRAGRDGKDASCIMFQDDKAVQIQEWMIRSSYPEKREIEQVFYALKRCSNSNGVAQITIEDLAKRSGVDSRIAGSALGILRAAKVLARNKDDDNPMRIQVLRDHADPTFQTILDLIKRIGFARADGFYELAQSFLVNESGLKAATLMTKIRNLDKAGYLKYALPFRGKTTQIIGDPVMVDHERIALRRAEQLKKLDEVEDFVNTPDLMKHDFLQEYFGVHE